MDRKKIILADLGLLLTAFIWGSGFVAAKNALDSLSPMYLMCVRFGVATLFTGIIFFKRVRKIDKQELIAGIIIGMFMFIAFTAQTIGMQYTLAGKSAFLTGTNVVIVPFLYWAVTKIKPDKFNIIAAIIMFIGIGLLTISLDSGFVLNKGDLLTLICAFFFACHITSIGCYAKKYDPIKLTFIQFAVTFLLSGIYAVKIGEFTLTIPSNGIVEAVYLGLFGTLLAFLIQNVAQKYTSPSHAALILCLESFFGSVLSVLFLGDVFTFNMVLGSILILVAVVIAETKLKFLSFLCKSDKETI